MPIPDLRFYLYTPTGNLEITDLVSQEAGAEITARIEAPGGANQFTAPDVSLKIRDNAAKVVYNALKAIQPASQNYRLAIKVGTVTWFYGPILPVSVQFDEIENAVAITATGTAIALASSNPATYFARPYGGVWKVYAQSGDPGSTVIRSVPPGPLGSAFAPGDLINFNLAGFSAQAVIRSIAATSGDETQWTVWFEQALSQQVPIGAFVTLDPSSAWKKNVVFDDAVSWCYQAAGLIAPVGSAYNAILQFGSAGQLIYNVNLMATPMNMAGIAGTPLGLSPNFVPGETFPYINDRQKVVIGTSSNVYIQGSTGPTSGWQKLNPARADGTPSQVYDWTSIETPHREYYLYGPQFLVWPYVPQGERIVEVYTYDYRPTSLPANRYVCRYEGVLDFDSMNTTFVVKLYKETTNDGYTWGSRTQLWSSGSLETSTQNMNEMAYDDPNFAYFTEYAYKPPKNPKGVPTYTGVGTPIQGKGTWGIGILCSNIVGNDYLLMTAPRLSAGAGSEVEWVASIFRMSDGTVMGTTAPGIRGWIGRRRAATLTDVRIFIARLDSFYRAGQDTSPNMLVGYWDGGLNLYPLTQQQVPYDIRPWTICQNENATDYSGLGYVFCLAASKELGVRLLQAGEYDLGFTNTAGYSVLAPPGATNDWCDLIVVKDRTRRGGINGEFYPMVGIWGGSLWWIDYLATGGLPTGDVSGMSSGDVLAQLCTLFNAAYWQLGDGTNYLKTRGLAASDWIGTTEGGSSVNDIGLLTQRAGPVWSKTYQRITITNEQNENISAAYPDGTDQWIGSDQELTISNRFIFSFSFAYALAKKIWEYFSQPIQTLEIEHEDDGRRWEVGFHFTCTVMGTYSRWQIIEVTRQAFASVLRVQAVRVG